MCKKYNSNSIIPMHKHGVVVDTAVGEAVDTTLDVVVVVVVGEAVGTPVGLCGVGAGVGNVG